MRAVVWKEAHKVTVDEIEDARIAEPTDVLVRLSTSAICGSDLHMYEGRAPVEPGMVFGHESLGVVEETGSAVRSVAVGERVVLPFDIACGFCFNCTRGFTNACLTTNPGAHSGGYGYSGMGPHRGGQAELVRVPYGGFNCLELPGVYFPQDPGGVGEDAKQGRFTLALGEAWNKGISIEMGQAPVKQYNVYLRDLIVAGLARPSFIVSHRLPLEAAPEAYAKFDQRTDGYTKVLLKPGQAAA